MTGDIVHKPGMLEALRRAGGPPRSRRETLLLTLVGVASRAVKCNQILARAVQGTVRTIPSLHTPSGR